MISEAMDDCTVPPSLRGYLASRERVAIAFSGGTDSSYLLYALRECGADFVAYTVRSAFQTAEETDDAVRLAESLGTETRIIDADVLSDARIISNPTDRCYHCKRLIFSSISRCASMDGCVCIMDGTNASDDPDGRPGMRALGELGIQSPLRECGITKRQVRELSRRANLPTWDRPSNSCLATRISTGIPITEEGLRRTESAEDELRCIGFSDIRVRTLPDGCRFEFTEAQKGLFEFTEARVRQILLKYYPSVRYSTREPGL